MKSDRLGSIALAAVAFFVVAFLQLPIIVVLLAAISETSYLTIPPKGLTLHWFSVVLNDVDYLAATWTSLWLALLSTLAAAAVGVMAALMIHRKLLPGAQLLSSLFMAPMILPSIVLGVALLHYFAALGIRGSSLGLILAHTVLIVPYVIRASLSGLQSIDGSLTDAARVLGAGPIETFRLVVLPLLKPALVAGGLLAFVTSLDNVPVSIFLLGANQTTLPVKIFASVEQGVDPSVAAASTLLILLTGAALVIAERWTGFHKHV